MRSLILIAHNLRSSHNVGSLLRTAEGLDVAAVYLTGHSPYPRQRHDARLPHLAGRTHDQIVKTALGAEHFVNWQFEPDILVILEKLKQENYKLAAVEQMPGAIKLPDFEPPAKLALIVGHEVDGLDPKVLKAVDYVIEIPMLGRKESFNVVQAAAMALYHCRFHQ